MVIAVRNDATIRSIRDGSARFALPRDLITTDRILQRWAESVGLGLPTEDWDDQPRVRVPPLPEELAVLVDECICHSPPRTREFVTRWYKTPQPAEVIGKRMGISRSAVYRAHAICLEFMRWKFVSTKDIGLIRLIERL